MPYSKQEFYSALVPRRILRFRCDELNSPDPHFFICVTIIQPETLNLSCCTSQFETVRRLIERNKFPNETLVFINPADQDNPFNKDTHINCNEYFPYYKEELWDKYQNGELEVITDLLPLHSFEQILIGFERSPNIEQEIKDSLPSIDSV